MTAPSLTDFILARIAEDEAAVKRATASPYYASGTPYGGAYEPMADDFGSSRTDFHLAVDPARVLAECEAKRRIVEMWLMPGSDMSHLYGGCRDDCEWKAIWYVMEILARVHADHPDWREEWA